MTALYLAAMALALLVLLFLVAHSRGHVRRGFPGSESAEALPCPTYPRVALIVPLTGDSPEMPAALTSLLTQSYPDYEVIFATRDLEDPATELARHLLARHPRGRHVVSGPAAGCSQKNRNILAALGVLDESVDILVFCDSTHRAPPHFLQELVRPLITGEALLTSGFHRVIPGDSRVATLGTLQTVLALHLMLGFAALVLPWGGATAVVRAVFRDSGAAGVLASNVLDDMPLGLHLLRYGVRTVPVSAAVLETHVAGQTIEGWGAWLTRQLLYLKYCLPGTWLAAALAVVLLGGPLLLSLPLVLGGLAGLVSPPLALGSLAFLLALTALGAWCRHLVPQPLPLGAWLLAFFANLGLAAWCYLKTWGTDIIAWRGISYRVTWGGRVREIFYEE